MLKVVGIVPRRLYCYAPAVIYILMLLDSSIGKFKKQRMDTTQKRKQKNVKSILIKRAHNLADNGYIPAWYQMLI